MVYRNLGSKRLHVPYRTNQFWLLFHYENLTIDLGQACNVDRVNLEAAKLAYKARYGHDHGPEVIEKVVEDANS